MKTVRQKPEYLQLFSEQQVRHAELVSASAEIAGRARNDMKEQIADRVRNDGGYVILNLIQDPIAKRLRVEPAMTEREGSAMTGNGTELQYVR